MPYVPDVNISSTEMYSVERSMPVSRVTQKAEAPELRIASFGFSPESEWFHILSYSLLVICTQTNRAGKIRCVSLVDVLMSDED